MTAKDQMTFRSTLAIFFLASAAGAEVPAAPEPAPVAPEPSAPAPTDAPPPAEAEAPASATEVTPPEAGPATGSDPESVEPKKARVHVVAAPAAKRPPPPPPEPVVLGDAAGRFELGFGLDLSFLGDEEYDLFSDSDALPQASLRAGLTVWQSGRWSVLAMAAGQYGAAGSSARGTPTHIDLGRLLLGAEVRGHVLSGLVGYGRLLAGAAIAASRVGQAGATDTLAFSAPAFSGGGTLGAAARLYGSKNGPSRSFRLEAYVEGGYDFASEIGLVYAAGPDGPSRPEPLDLGVLSASGARFGFGLQGSY
jgi:hypothetical protein